ncbi:MAG: hypothetical protein EOO60_03010 [Hymenobacter sp.]|nr:MAG: hypothetical protein EOO60_03010 [Hymenobacter sp.]
MLSCSARTFLYLLRSPPHMKQSYTFLLWLLVALSLWEPLPLSAQVLDPAFLPTVLKVPYAGTLQGGVQRVVVQPDGKLLIAGGFDFANGMLAGKIQRLNTDGTSDAAFNQGGFGANGFIGAMVLQADGKIVIAGGFTTYNNTPALTLARLNSNGTLDANFASAILPAQLRQLTSLAIQPDGKILVGSSGNIGGGQSDLLARFNTNGSLDTSFQANASGYFSDIAGNSYSVRSILVQADGKILVGGSLSGQNRCLIRLN